MLQVYRANHDPTKNQSENKCNRLHCAFELGFEENILKDNVKESFVQIKNLE